MNLFPANPVATNLAATKLSKTNVSRPESRALTLIEMLIGMAITLVMMAAVVTLFANIGAGIRVQKAAMEMSSQLRTTRARLFMDLAGATCAPRPKLPTDDHDDGYIEIIEGVFSDKNPSGLLDGGGGNGELDYALSQVPSGNDPSIVVPSTSTRVVASNDVTNGGGLGDYDDILALTVRSESEPFVGRYVVWEDPDGAGPEPVQWVVNTIESNLAEVIWYAVENPADTSVGLDEPGMRTVYRRVLLIAPWVSELPPYMDTAVPAKDVVEDRAYFRLCDISFRREGDLRVPNTLADLTKRENRFAHHINGASVFPHIMQTANIHSLPLLPLSDDSPLHPFGEVFEGIVTPDRTGEDVMLNDVLAFDLRVFDPGAPILDAAGTVVEPSEAGWDLPAPPVNLSPVGFGAYVDLHWDIIDTWSLGTQRGWTPPANAPAPLFNGVPNLKSGLNFSTAPIASVAYDTWSYHYENDGLDQDDTTGNDNISDNNTGTGAIDEGTDGLDSDNANGTDDVLERETSPPYDVPLRGIQVKLRVYEPDTRQIREATITRGMVPQ